MKYLLDTHALIWFTQDHPNLSIAAKGVIENPENICYISMGSIWEMAIKMSLNRLKIQIPFEDMESELENLGFIILPISFRHLSHLHNLEFHHRDPFDRLLISQAQVENFRLITSDPEFKKYNVNLMW